MRRGFSLIELSIVITIVGLIAGSVMYGKELIHKSEIRKIIATSDEYHSALRVFEDNYGYLPGDLPDADEYWPTDCVDYTDNQCEGDGDGLMLGASETSTLTEEKTRAWQHLALAGLIEGSYPGTKTIPFLETEIPKAPFNGFFYIGHMPDLYSFKRNRYIALEYGAVSTSVVVIPSEDPRGVPNGAVVSPRIAYAVDQKIDDGVPAKGKVLSLNPGIRLDYGDCIDDNAYAANPNFKDTSDTDILCRMFFLR